MAKLTKTIVDATQSGSRPRFIWDDVVKGFGLLVLPSGVKSYIFQYRTFEGSNYRSRRITLGRHGVLTVEQARIRAREIQYGLYSNGTDPLEEKRKLREALIVTTLLEMYLESAKFAEKAETTQITDRGRIENHLKPALGKKFLHRLTPEDVRVAYTVIRDGKTIKNVGTYPRGKRVQGGAGAARCTIRLFKSVLSWAVSEGHVAVNVAHGVSVGRDGTRETIIESVADYQKLFRTLDIMQQEQRLRPQAADAIRVLILTGARRSEIAGLRWKSVDLKRGVIVLTQHKTARSGGKPRIIGLPAAAQTIITKQPPGNDDDYVFPPARGHNPLNLTNPWVLIRKEAGLPINLTLHGLRHSLASWMAMQGAQAAEIMTAMGHSQLSTVQRYIHWAQNGHALLAERAAASIVGAMGAGSSAEIIPLKKRQGA